VVSTSSTTVLSYIQLDFALAKSNPCDIHGALRGAKRSLLLLPAEGVAENRRFGARGRLSPPNS